MRWASAILAAGLLATACEAAPPSGQLNDWKVTSPLHGKTTAGDLKPAEDVSGMACEPADGGRRLCLLVDDETQGAQVVNLNYGSRTAKPGQYIPLIRDELAGKPLELDAEGAAYADGSFYVLGSHGRSRHEKEGDEEKNRPVRRPAAIFSGFVLRGTRST